MKKTIRLQGLDCANCAAKMERAINKIPNIIDASINFITGKLVIEAPEQQIEDVLNDIKRTVKKIEPSVSIQ